MAKEKKLTVPFNKLSEIFRNDDGETYFHFPATKKMKDAVATDPNLDKMPEEEKAATVANYIYQTLAQEYSQEKNLSSEEQDDLWSICKKFKKADRNGTHTVIVDQDELKIMRKRMEPKDIRLLVKGPFKDLLDSYVEAKEASEEEEEVVKPEEGDAE